MAHVKIDFKTKIIQFKVGEETVESFEFQFETYSNVAYVRVDVDRTTGEIRASFNGQVIGKVFQHDSFKTERILIQ